jgi:hypothetical protein
MVSVPRRGDKFSGFVVRLSSLIPIPSGVALAWPLNVFFFLWGTGLKKQRQESVAFPNYPLTTVTTTVPNPHQHIHTIMASPPTHVHASWHVEQATSLPEIWARIAVFSGPVGGGVAADGGDCAGRRERGRRST